MSGAHSVGSPWGFEGEGHSAWTKQVELAGLTAESAASSGDSENKKNEITRKHWKTSGSHCSNKECKVKLTLIQRAHHCRRCGGRFCENCLKYRRRLNHLANPDPDGKQYKVCQQCFEEGKDNQGVTHSLTASYLALRSQRKELQRAAEKSLRDMSWRHRFDLEAECKRLIAGFKSAVGNSELKRSLHEMRTIIAVPEWQKSPYWLMEVTADICQICKSKFSLMRKKHHCRLCSKSLCKRCSSKDLLVFVPDEDRSDQTDPKLAIIKINGSPTVEPEVSLTLRICKLCQEKMVDRQLNNVEKEFMEQGQDVFADLIVLHNSAQRIRESVSRQLLEYQVIVDSLEDNTSHKDKDNKSNIKTLAKSQEDVADFLSQLVVKIQHLKKLRPESNAQAILFKNCLKSNCDFYFENLHQFRDQMNKLSESAPPNVLEMIQRTVDKHAIVSTQLYIRQLVYEAIHLSEKHKLNSVELQGILIPVDQTIEEEAKWTLHCDGDDWDQHTQVMLTLLGDQIKNHRLIKPSRRLQEKEGSKHVSDVLKWRCSEVLQQVHVQINMKAANRSFQKSKNVLKDASERVKTCNV
ncbi:uncharacterized protein LOC132552871 [Ylistrum balloti]|uniref:uncharacterized protein LOC132552871 n=1 Tax=Ylistrum balloti TaxID=509963 RepID=UPI0029058491|nr:uncharacterized protein LOC132552871 [Ylistrum balloti]